MESKTVWTDEEIRSSVRSFIVETFLFGSAEAMAGDTESFIKKGVMDSTGILELIEFLEEKFRVKVKEEETIPENLDSLESVVRFVARKQSP